MTVTATFEFPGSKKPLLHAPVCTERFFSETIEPISESLGLNLISNWGTFSEISSDNLEEFKNQLSQLMSTIQSSGEVSEQEKVYAASRLGNLSRLVREIFSEEATTLLFLG
jgi:hypothetical protein